MAGAGGVFFQQGARFGRPIVSENLLREFASVRSANAVSDFCAT